MRWISLALLAACSGGDPPTEATGDPTPPPPLSDLPTSSCDNLDHEWVDLEQMGQLVAWERAAELDLSAATIAGTLSLAGYPSDILPIQYDVQMYRIRYTTQDRGRVVETTGLMSVPVATGAFPMVVWTHGTTGFMDDCAPSGQGIEGAAGNLLLSSLGAVVVAPDYLGMNGWGEPSDMLHPYVIAEPTAVATLDSIRAGWALLDEDSTVTATLTDDVVLFGGSEGGFAALWSERYAPWYLPEANITAVVASVPPTDLWGLAQRGADTFSDTTGGLAAALASHADWYGYQQPLSDVLIDEPPTSLASTLPVLMDETCDFGDAFDGVDTVEQAYTEAFIAAMAADSGVGFEEFECGLKENSLVTPPFERISDTPVYYVISGADDLVWHESNRRDVPRLCDQGYVLEVLECEGASHSEGAVMSLPAQWQWVQDRLAGLPLGETCVLPTPVDCETYLQ